MNSKDVKVHGIDTSRVCVDELLKDGISCAHGSVFSERPVDNYDLVTFVHVLEHVLDVNECVKRLCEVTHKSLYIEVPDSTRYLTYPPFQDFNLEHINHFTLGTLIRLFERNGMRCIKSKSDKNIHSIYGNYPAICCLFVKEPNGIKSMLQNVKGFSNRL